MKLMFIITSKTNKIGGHYFSFKTIVEALTNEYDCCVVCIGNEICPPLLNMKAKFYHVKLKKVFSFVTILVRVFKICGKEKPDIINAYDLLALFVGRTISFLKKVPIIHTICGGPNPIAIEYPYVKDVVVFSEENRKHFSDETNFGSRNIYLIPNRVSQVRQDYSKINEIRNLINEKAKVILRITRIGITYYESIKQGIELVKRLNDDGVNVRLIVVGSVQNENIREEIQKDIEKTGVIITEPKFTDSASEIIDIADLVLGTGRSLMEGASLSKPLLSPMRGCRYPVLITEDNCENFARINFSGRLDLNNYDEEQNYQDIKSLLVNGNIMEKYQELSFHLFKNEYSIDKGMDLYRDVFHNIKYHRDTYAVNYVYHLMRSFKQVSSAG